MAANGTPKIEQILLDMLAHTLFGKDNPEVQGEINWGLVWYEAYMQAVSLTAFCGSAPPDCDEKTLSHIRKGLADALRRSLQVNKAHIKLHAVMTRAGIPYVVLKGMASARYYPDPIMRSMGDVDFMVSESDVEKTCRLLSSLGFERTPNEHEKHIVLCDGDFNYELHTVPAGVPKGEKGAPVRELLKDTLAQAVTVQTDFGAISVPSDFHHGLIILLHTCSHLTNEGIGLRQLCDWAAFLRRFSGNEFPEMFEKSLKKVGLWKFACVLTQVCVKYLGCPACDWSACADEYSVDGMIADIFKNGNFGQKNSAEVQERVLVSDGAQKSLLRSVFARINSIVYFYWNFTRKFKFLLPIGWIYFGGRYLLRSLTGKRAKIDLKNIKEKADTRTRLYKSMRLFDEEYSNTEDIS